MKMKPDTYTKVFSQVHSSFEINEEEFELRSKKQKASKRIMKELMVVAASMVIVLGISVTTYATKMFGMNKLVVTTPVPTTNHTIVATSPSNAVEEEENKKHELLFAQGWQGSPEAMAADEWNTFEEAYMEKHPLTEEEDHSDKFEKEYGMYFVYTKEMANKVDEIAKKHGLKLHKSMTTVGSKEELEKKLGKKLKVEEEDVEGGYVYEDGSFRYDGTAEIRNDKKVGYQFGDLRKGMFSTMFISTNELKEYTQWSYHTKDGQRLLLAMSKDRSLIVTEGKKSFISVNVLEGSEKGDNNPLTKEELEQFAETLDYSVFSK